MAECCAYSKERHLKSAHRIWREVGWVTSDEDYEALMDMRVARGPAYVAELDGEAECMVLAAPGNVRYLGRDLSFTGIMTVMTSRVARKQGLAGRLAAHAIAIDAAEGALVAGLGMFEQGFYNQLGFGTGAYEHWVSFDPAQLRLRSSPRIPRRVTVDDWKVAHASRLARIRGHGSVSFDRPEATYLGMRGEKEHFGLGYFDGPAGELTHHVWGAIKEEHGPYEVWWMSYRTGEQFLELMGLLRNLGDQVRLVQMAEPPGIQLQDLVRQPFRWRQMTEQSKYRSQIESVANVQLRICSLPGCLEKTHLPGGGVSFNLRLSDPIESFLANDATWRGVGGEYVVTLGPSSGAACGHDANLPTLVATVGAFTRLWLGVRPATWLAVTDDLLGPPELLAQLDAVLRLPAPMPDWSF